MKLSLLSFSFPGLPVCSALEDGKRGQGLRVPACLKVKDMEQGAVTHSALGVPDGWRTGADGEKTAWRLCVPLSQDRKAVRGGPHGGVGMPRGQGSSDGGCADKELAITTVKLLMLRELEN